MAAIALNDTPFLRPIGRLATGSLLAVHALTYRQLEEEVKLAVKDTYVNRRKK